MENWLQGMDGFSYCIEMLAASFCFFIFLKKRNHFWIRVVISIAILFVASLIIYPYFTDITNVYNWVWFIFIFALIIAICFFAVRLHGRMLSWQLPVVRCFSILPPLFLL